MAEEKQVTTHTVESHEEKPKRTRKKRKPRAEAAAPKSAKDDGVELEISEDEETDLSPNHVAHDGATITLNGDVSLRVMTLDEQKVAGIKSITGEMGKKCKKSPVIITFKNPRAALVFFDMCLYAEKESEEFILVGKKVEWDSSSLEVSL